MLTKEEYAELKEAVRDGFAALAKAMHGNSADHDTLVTIKTLVEQQKIGYDRDRIEHQTQMALLKQSTEKAHSRVDAFESKIHSVVADTNKAFTDVKAELTGRIDRVLVAGGLTFLGLFMVVVAWLIYKAVHAG